MSKTARTLDLVLDAIVEQAASGEPVKLTGFGVFGRSYRSARVVRNPATDERKPVGETWVPRFKAGEAFRREVAERRAGVQGGHR